ncbi:MAG: XRE family transcriptional regulator [Gammaproteobacteria bacterium]|nr:XRE family transcriptional regulator [Gammaproteobacteria bacterium]
MARKFSELKARMSPQSRSRAASQAQAMLDEIPLYELRKARGLSQKTLAELLHVQQPAVARLERRTDMYISTLRNHIEAMGGELEILARFSEGAVRIANFSEIEPAATQAVPSLGPSIPKGQKRADSRGRSPASR